MNQEKRELQNILDEMFAAEKEFTFEVVRMWQKRHPQFEREIAEAVNDWREFAFFALDDESAEASPLSQTAENAMRKALENSRSPFIVMITDLRELAEEKGIDRKTLPEKLGVSETLMRRLERRNLKEIPRFVEEKLAEIFSVTVENWQAFFDLPASLPKAARYKSKDAPQTQSKESFAEAVKDDPQLTEEQKQKLLDLAKK